LGGEASVQAGECGQGRATPRGVPPGWGWPPGPKPPEPGWGGLEAFVLLQFLIPAVVFWPGAGAGALRIASRAAVFGLGLVVWVAVAWAASGAVARRRLSWRARWQPSSPFPARHWLLASLVWQLVMVLHPTTNSLASALASVTLAASVAAPAFFVGLVEVTPARLKRLVLLVFVTQAFHAGLGVAQVARPELFLPPSLKHPENPRDLIAKAYAYVDGSGRLVVRPPGLSDQPGAASATGASAGLLGMALAVAPGVAWGWRLVGLSGAALGLLAISFSMVRAALAVELFCLAALVGLWILQRRIRQLVAFGGVAGFAALGVLTVVLASPARGAILERFGSLVRDDPSKLYQEHRGRFLTHTFETMLVEMPLGGGLGRWGMIHVYFGNPNSLSGSEQYWVEIQWSAWALDGGWPLVIVMTAALGAAVRSTWRAAHDPLLEDPARYWSGVILAWNLSVLALTLSYVPFVSPMGAHFWLLAASCARCGRTWPPVPPPTFPPLAANSTAGVATAPVTAAPPQNQ